MVQHFEERLDGPTLDSIGDTPVQEPYDGSIPFLALEQHTLHKDSMDADVDEQRIETALVS